MRLDRSGVDRQGHAIISAVGQRREDSLPTSALGPAIEAIVDRRVRTIFGRAIAPARAALQHVYDAADDAPIIFALWSSQVGRQSCGAMYAHCLSFSQNNPARINASRAESLGTRESELAN